MTGILALFPVLLAGVFIRGMLRPHPWPAAILLEELPAIFGLGAGALFLCFLALSLTGRASLLALHLFVALLGVSWLLLRRWTRKREIPADISPRLDPRDLLCLGALAAIVLLLSGIGFQLPLFDWEARILWALKARILAADPALSGEAFRDPYLLHIHPRYPLLVPFLSSWMARNQGAFLEWNYQFLIDTFALLTVWQVYMLLRGLTHIGVALVLAAVMALTGVWTTSLFGSRVEIALAFFLVLAVHRLFLWLERRRASDLILGGAFLFCGAMTKNEGMLLALCAILAIFLVVLAEDGIRAALRATMPLAGVVILLSAAWIAHLVQIPPVSDENYLNRLSPDIFVQGAGRLPWIAGAVLDRVTDPSSWHLLWLTPFLAAAALFRRGADDDSRLRMASILALAYIAGLLGIYVISPWRDINLHVLVTFDRVALPLLPVFIVMAALACKDPGSFVAPS